MSRSRGHLGRITRDWERLGAEDPLWAVYVAPGTRGGKWDQEAFFETGRTEVARVMAFVTEAGCAPKPGVALDFGCGVGRLSQALATRFTRVIGVDVSESMLERARALAAGCPNVSYLLNQRDDLRGISDASVDLVYTSLVLQHMSRELAAKYLAEFMRVLSRDGVAVVQVATRPTASVKGVAFRLLPPRLLGLAQRAVLRYPAPMRMQAMPEQWVRSTVSAAGGRIVAQESDPTYGGHWVYTRYLIVRAPS